LDVPERVSSHRRRDRAIESVLAEYRHQQHRRHRRKESRMPQGPVRLKTAGLVHPKVPAQALTTLAVAALAHFGLDIDDETSAAIGVVLGFAAGYLAPAAPTVTTRKGA
jgi:hypothetical protein